MTQVSMARSAITARRAWRSLLSGVVRTLCTRSSPIRVSTVPMRPVRWPSASRAEEMR